MSDFRKTRYEHHDTGGHTNAVTSTFFDSINNNIREAISMKGGSIANTSYLTVLKLCMTINLVKARNLL
jgi:hypothetical protein